MNNRFVIVSWRVIHKFWVDSFGSDNGGLVGLVFLGLVVTRVGENAVRFHVVLLVLGVSVASAVGGEGWFLDDIVLMFWFSVWILMKRRR